jgi:hypothetical protein
MIFTATSWLMRGLDDGGGGSGGGGEMEVAAVAGMIYERNIGNLPAVVVQAFVHATKVPFTYFLKENIAILRLERQLLLLLLRRRLLPIIAR